MMTNLPYSEYIDWLAYFSVEPFPEERADLRNAMLIASIATMLGGKPKIKDFMIDYWGEYKDTSKQTPEEVLAKFKLIFGAMGRKEG